MTETHEDRLDSLARPATLAVIDDLERAGILNRSATRTARRHVLSQRQWLLWADRLLFALGLVLLLAGLACLVAANWQSMTGLKKIVLAALGLALTAGGAAWAKEGSLLRQGLLLAASTFVGVVFLVIGQVYQTGADAWELFALWAVLMSGFVVALPSAPMLAFHLTVLDTAYILYFEQVAQPSGANWPLFWCGLFVLQLGFYWGSFRIRQALWYKRLLLLACLSLAVTPVCFGIALWPSASGAFQDYIGPIVACVVGLPFAWRLYVQLADIRSFSLVVFALEAIVLTGIGRVMLEMPLFGYEIFLFGLILVFATGKAVAIIRKWHRRMEEHNHA
ncbi:DUF2157 domain-containing protein [Desulfovibrio inopinatus]|uniref:DUF2157 domain-containing protein n=1 Tax=Desulfovibrio inopinatus TaxID=102109 RepID=UPI000425746F|nr:DUF2157 domain-containing protein [Desulfovibrio inopinatus]